MKYIVFAFLMLLLCQSAFSQSKKDQIETLIFQKDSLKKVIEFEREKDSTKKAKQDQLISAQNGVIKQLENQLSQSKRMIEELSKKLMMLEGRVQFFSDSAAFLKSELTKYQALELNHFIGEWLGEDEFEGGSIIIGGSIFDGYSATYTTFGPFQETYRIERIDKNKIILYLLAVEGTMSFNESMGNEFFEIVNKCSNEKFAEVEILSEYKLKINTNFLCSYLPTGWTRSFLSPGIYTKKKSEN
jgi:hypothetical protein